MYLYSLVNSRCNNSYLSFVRFTQQIDQTVSSRQRIQHLPLTGFRPRRKYVRKRIYPFDTVESNILDLKSYNIMEVVINIILIDSCFFLQFYSLQN